ncbi:MFS transporter [Streptomyces alkaliphilus]|uniref:MFS transporter n=1 Tax=Streptomyces alkaliphilus TaxID=1472722 RepID=UPI00117F5D93|nr:MFS transporter [Streptomyces alkaliphilus]MQS05659.1 MFS transporter [Streptomyces alkaliphilus]
MSDPGTLTRRNDDQSGEPGALDAAFWCYWTAQTTSSLGSSIATFALPLIVYQLTGSGMALGIGFAVALLPQLLFGLLVGALGDRLDRRRVLMFTNVARSAVIAVIPVVALLGALEVWVIYVVLFIQSVLAIFFQTACTAAVPKLVGKQLLVQANSRLQAGNSAAMIAGPFLAGLAVAVMPVVDLLFLESATFLISALLIVAVRRPLNDERRRDDSPDSPLRRILQDVRAGLSYVWHQPTLRNIALMMAVINFAGTTVTAQLPLFVDDRFGADDTVLAWFYASAGVGILLVSALAGPLHRRVRLRTALFVCLIADGALTIVLGFSTNRWWALAVWALASGAGVLFNIFSLTLRQSIVPDELMSRVMSVAAVIAWSAIPLGALTGGVIIELVGRPGLVYSAIGCLTLVVVAVFSRTDLGRDPGLPTGDGPGGSN